MNPFVKNHPDQIDKLIQDYPVVFRNMDTSVISSVPAGWYSIVDDLCTNLTPLLEEALQANPESPDEPLFSLLQIKEKFGGLRIYFMMNTKNDDLYIKVQKMIDIAEDASYETCQITGKPGVLCKNGRWFMTLCEESRISMGYKTIENG
jgi:hypothetical protein